MIPLTVTPDIDRAPWDDLKQGWSINADHGGMAVVERVGLLRHGTQEGRATLGLCIRFPDGTFAFAETTLRLAHFAAVTLAATPAYAEEDFS